MFEWKKTKSSRETGKSFDDLFALHRGSLTRFVTAKISDPGEAEDIVQECFIRFQKKYGDEAVDSPGALLARIATNLVIDRVRESTARSGREQAWGQLNIAGADDANACTESVDPARALSAKQQVAEAMSVIDGLHEKTRKVFMLHRFEGLTHAQVSERLDMPRSTVEKHMIRAIKALSVLKDKK